MLDQPGITLRHDLIALPEPFGGGSTALYDLNGRRVDDTNIVVTPPSHTMFKKEYAWAPEQIEVPPDLNVVEETVLFAGIARNHFGHFLLDSMSRMWAVADTSLPCVFPGAPSVRGDYYTTIMDTFPVEVMAPAQPTLYRRIMVPDPTMTNDKVWPSADRAHLMVTERIHHTPQKRSPIFLSRTGFKSKAREWAPALEIEQQLDAEMEALGLTVAHPERLPFAEQIAIFNESPLIVGLLGSAFHTALFSRKSYRGRLVLLTFREEHSRGRYGLIDSIKNYTPTYVRCSTLNRAENTLDIDLKLAVQRVSEALNDSRLAIS